MLFLLEDRDPSMGRSSVWGISASSRRLTWLRPWTRWNCDYASLVLAGRRSGVERNIEAWQRYLVEWERQSKYSSLTALHGRVLSFYAPNCQKLKLTNGQVLNRSSSRLLSGSIMP